MYSLSDFRKDLTKLSPYLLQTLLKRLMHPAVVQQLEYENMQNPNASSLASELYNIVKQRLSQYNINSIDDILKALKLRGGLSKRQEQFRQKMLKGIREFNALPIEEQQARNKAHEEYVQQIVRKEDPISRAMIEKTRGKNPSKWDEFFNKVNIALKKAGDFAVFQGFEKIGIPVPSFIKDTYKNITDPIDKANAQLELLKEHQRKFDEDMKKRTGGKSKSLVLHAVIFRKPYSLAKAQQEAKAIMKTSKDKYYRDTPTSYRFRNIAKTKFIPKSYKTKKINNSISLVFGYLK